MRAGPVIVQPTGMQHGKARELELLVHTPAVWPCKCSSCQMLAKPHLASCTDLGRERVTRLPRPAPCYAWRAALCSRERWCLRLCCPFDCIVAARQVQQLDVRLGCAQQPCHCRLLCASESRLCLLRDRHCWPCWLLCRAAHLQLLQQQLVLRPCMTSTIWQLQSPMPWTRTLRCGSAGAEIMLKGCHCSWRRCG